MQLVEVARFLSAKNEVSGRRYRRERIPVDAADVLHELQDREETLWVHAPKLIAGSGPRGVVS